MFYDLSNVKIADDNLSYMRDLKYYFNCNKRYLQ